MRLFTTTALAAVLAVPGAAMAQTTGQTTDQTTVDGGQMVSLDQWQYEDLYQQGWSAENFIDEMEVYDEAGEDIGDVEDLIVDPQGNLLAVIAEVGGFWDIGDTHVSVPWSEIAMNEARDGVTVPVTEANVDDYDVFANSGLQGSALGEQVSSGVDDVEFQRAFRVSEIIGDYARLQDEQGQPIQAQQMQGQQVQGQQMQGQQPVQGTEVQQMQDQQTLGQQMQDEQIAPDVDEQGLVSERVQPMRGMMNYGYVSDVIIRDGQIAATVVDAGTGYRPGYYAYPFHGYGTAGGGWEPGSEYYDMPYAGADITGVEPYEYEEMQADVGDRNE